MQVSFQQEIGKPRAACVTQIRQADNSGASIEGITLITGIHEKEPEVRVLRMQPMILARPDQKQHRFEMQVNFLQE
jgi:hypothetical protein